MKKIIGFAAAAVFVIAGSAGVVLHRRCPLISLAVGEALRDGLADNGQPASDWQPLSESQSSELAVQLAPYRNARLTGPEVSAGAGRKRLICIDPGHPSLFSRGDKPLNGTTEAHINWLVALRLRDVLKAGGADVMMTKSLEEELVDNRDRAVMINKAAADYLAENPGAAALAVHLHCDDSPDQKGFAVYYPDREGKYAGVSGNEPDIGFVGPDEEIRRSSRCLAEAVEAGMKKRLKGRLNALGVKGDSKTYVGGWQGALTASIFSKVPTITIEMVTLNRISEAEFIKTPRGQKRMAEAIAAGLLSYGPENTRPE